MTLIIFPKKKKKKKKKKAMLIMPAVLLLAQLVERCTGIAEVMGSNTVRACIFFKPYFNY